MRSGETGGRTAGINCSWTSSGSSSGGVACWIREPGKTVDVSSGGICFDAGRHLPEGLNVELSISWPVLLHNVAPMQLVATGKIVRSNGRQVAIQTTQHEFRTAGASAEQRNTQLGKLQQSVDAGQFAGVRGVRQTVG